MKAIVTILFFIIFIAVLATEARTVSFVILGIMGAAIVAALLDATHT